MVVIRIVEQDEAKMHGEATIADTTPLPAVGDSVRVDSGLVLVVKEREFRYVPTGDGFDALIVTLSCVPAIGEGVE